MTHEQDKVLILIKLTPHQDDEQVKHKVILGYKETETVQNSRIPGLEQDQETLTSFAKKGNSEEVTTSKGN